MIHKHYDELYEVFLVITIMNKNNKYENMYGWSGKKKENLSLF